MIRVVHTIIWALMVACIVALPIAGWLGHYTVAAALTAVVLGEVLVLALNGGRCPLTSIAARYTADRRDNFDIYLPLSIARHNKAIFGTVFVLGEALVVARWLGWLSR